MASPPPVPPITNQFPIVTADGRPSDYFIRWLQERGLEINGSVTPEQVAQLIQEWSAARSVVAGTGLAGGGSLDSDVTLNLDAVLGQLNDVDFSTPPTDGQVIVYDAGSSTWKPANQSGGGGGSSTLAAAQFTVDQFTFAITVDKSKNVSGVTRLSSGVYQIDFTTPMSDVFYSTLVNGRYNPFGNKDAPKMGIYRQQSGTDTEVTTGHVVVTNADGFDVIQCSVLVFDASL